MADLKGRYQQPDVPRTPTMPPATMGELFDAGRTLQAVDNSDAEFVRMQEDYRRFMEPVNDARRREGLPDIRNPALGLRLQDRDQRGSLIIGGSHQFVPVGREAAARDFYGELSRIRRKHPGFLPEAGDSADTLRAKSIAREQERRAKARAVQERGDGVLGTVAGFAGTVTKAVEDPGVFLSVLAGGGGGGLLAVTARETVINTLATAMLQPQIATNREAIGEELTTREAVGNSLVAGVIGGALGGALHVGLPALGRGAAPASEAVLARVYDALPEPMRKRWASAADIPDDALPEIAEAVIGADRFTPDIQAAVQVLRRKAEVQQTTPFSPGWNSALAHEERLAAALADIVSDAPVKPRAGTAMATGVVPAPRGTGGAGSRGTGGDVFEALVIQESGGRAGISGPQTRYGQAHGLTQVLDATGQGIAKRIGVDWRPDLMRGTSPEAAAYQRKIGRAYYEEGLRKYNGDVRKALMYYHGGPDERIWGPKTRAYADAIMARARVSDGAVTDVARLADGGDDSAARLAALDAEEAALVSRETSPDVPRGELGSAANPTEEMVANRTYAVPADAGEAASRLQQRVDRIVAADADPMPSRGAATLDYTDRSLRNAVAQASVRLTDDAGLARPIAQIAAELADQRALTTVLREEIGVITGRDDLRATAALFRPEIDVTTFRAEMKRAEAEGVTAANEAMLRQRINARGADSRASEATRWDADDPRWAEIDRMEAAGARPIDPTDDPVWNEIDRMQAEDERPAMQAGEGAPIEAALANDAFGDPHGPAAQAQTASLLHDLKMMADAEPGTMFRLGDEGAERPLRDILDELAEDDAALAAVRGCL